MQDLMGFIAATLTTLAFVPQAWQSYKTRDLSGISLPMYGLFSLGVAFWLGYGVMMMSWPIIIANSITLLLALLVLTLKLMSKNTTCLKD